MSFSSSVLDAIDRLLNKYNGNPYDQSTNEGGMAIGGHRVNEIPMAQDVANVASAVATEAAAAATSATNAADSESNAATSESNAADSATSAAADADRAEAAAAQLDVQNNFVATTDPTANNDSADTAASGTEYNVGSVWINTTSDEAFRCVDASVGAAVWVPTTVTAEDLGTMAQQDANNDNFHVAGTGKFTVLGSPGAGLFSAPGESWFVLPAFFKHDRFGALGADTGDAVEVAILPLADSP